MAKFAPLDNEGLECSGRYRDCFSARHPKFARVIYRQPAFRDSRGHPAGSSYRLEGPLISNLERPQALETLVDPRAILKSKDGKSSKGPTPLVCETAPEAIPACGGNFSPPRELYHRSRRGAAEVLFAIDRGPPRR